MSSSIVRISVVLYLPQKSIDYKGYNIMYNKTTPKANFLHKPSAPEKRLDEAAALLNVAIRRLVCKNNLKCKNFSGLTFERERYCSFNQA